MTIDRDQKSGLFIVSYNVNKPGQAGGLNLRLDLTVYTPSRQVTGRATITHATLQPLVFEHPIQGRYEEQGRDIELHLVGTPRLHEQHAQNQAHAAGHALLEQFFFDGQLKDGWQAGNGSKARYAFFQNQQWHEQLGQEVRLADEINNAIKALNLR